MTEKPATGTGNFILHGKRLHSSFDPEKEAARFVASSINKAGTGDAADAGNASSGILNPVPEAPSTIVVCGEGAGFITGAVKKSYPSAKVITLFYTDDVYTLYRENRTASPDYFWYPGCGQDLVHFLHGAISELDIEGFRMLEWPASAALFPESARSVRTALSQVLKEKRGTLVTTIAAGKQWIRNSFSNFISIHSPDFQPLNPRGLPVVIAASGPTLEKSLHIMKKRREKFYLLSLPSSVLCLSAYGIIPDAVVMTDPSFYSSYHLRWPGTDMLPVVMPISAAAISSRHDLKITIVTQHQFFEDWLLGKTGISFPSVLSHGTVAGTALQIALAHTENTVFIAGLDLCFYDIQSHVRPHAFDRLLECDADRLSPYYNRKFSRALQFAPEYDPQHRTRTSLALKTYEGWFRQMPDSEKRRVVRIQPFSPVNDILPSITPFEFDEYLASAGKKNESGNIGTKKQPAGPEYPDTDRRIRIADEVLCLWTALIDNEYEKIAAAGKIDSLITNDQVLRLLYFIDMKTLNHLKRKIRTDHAGSCLEPVLEMLDNARLFLGRISGKIHLIKGN